MPASHSTDLPSGTKYGEIKASCCLALSNSRAFQANRVLDPRLDSCEVKRLLRMHGGRFASADSLAFRPRRSHGVSCSGDDWFLLFTMFRGTIDGRPRPEWEAKVDIA
jgi:hypothetical protein